MTVNIKRAKKLAALAFENEYPFKYREKYIYLMLQILAVNNEHQKAIDFLIKNRYKLSEQYKYLFGLFYEQLDINYAKKYFILGCYFHKQFIQCHDLLYDLLTKKSNLLFFYGKLMELSNENPYAMAILGKIYKQGKYILRDLEKSCKYFLSSAKNKCPLGYYYMGKEYFNGRYADQNFVKAEKLLKKAFANDEPRAYEIYNLKYIKDGNSIEYLKTGAIFGHKRALYKYGKFLYEENNSNVGKNESLGIEYLRQSCYQKYNKAIKFCMLNRISFKTNNSVIESTNSTDDMNDNIFNPDIKYKKKNII